MRRAFKFLLTGRKYQLGDLVPAGGSGSGLLRWVLAGSKTPQHDASKGERLRLALQELGPVPIKFGQLLSTRRDLLTDDLADELSLLQDKVAPFDSALAAASIKRIRKVHRYAFSRV